MSDASVPESASSITGTLFEQSIPEVGQVGAEVGPGIDAVVPEKPRAKRKYTKRKASGAKPKKPKRGKVSVSRVAVRKKAALEAERRLAPLRDEMMRELSQNMSKVAGEPSSVHVSLLRLHTFMHFLRIFLPFLVFWNAEEEKPVKRRTRKGTSRAKKTVSEGGEAPQRKPRKPRIKRTVIAPAA